MSCTHHVNVRGGSCGAATRPCALKVVYTDPRGREWCKRHQPDEERKRVWERIARRLYCAGCGEPEPLTGGDDLATSDLCAACARAMTGDV